MDVTTTADKRRVLTRSPTDEDPTDTTKPKLLDSNTGTHIVDDTAQANTHAAPEPTHHADAEAAPGAATAAHDQSDNAQC